LEFEIRPVIEGRSSQGIGSGENLEAVMHHQFAAWVAVMIGVFTAIALGMLAAWKGPDA
jgi:hypothetical protein